GLVPVKVDALEKAVALLEQRYQAFSGLLVSLHEAATRKDWREVVRISEQVLAMAPQHLEARKARARAWQAIDPQTVSSPGKIPEKVEESAHKPEPSPRFLLWIDGIGGFLVCLGNRVMVGQATAEAGVEIPLYADVSRIHATLI